MRDARVFIDSTTFLYTRDRAEPAKGNVAEGWLKALAEHDAGVTNLQVLNELVSVITRKKERFVGRDPFLEADIVAIFGSAPLSSDAALSARAIFARYHYSWWDCLLLASALEHECTHFLSEDMQDGQHVALGAEQGLTIISPFAHSPLDILTLH
jgi:predicted nucleic acid-binding protein